MSNISTFPGKLPLFCAIIAVFIPLFSAKNSLTAGGRAIYNRVVNYTPEVDFPMKQRFSVTGMSCTACSSHVERAVSALAGVRSVSVDLMQNRMTVDYDENALSPEAI